MTELPGLLLWLVQYGVHSHAGLSGCWPAGSASVTPQNLQPTCLHRTSPLLQAMKRDWASSALGAIDMSVLSRLADPQVVAEAQKHPEFYKVSKGDLLSGDFTAFSVVQLQVSAKHPD